MSHAAALIPREEALLPAGHPWTRLPAAGLVTAAAGLVLLALAGGADPRRGLAAWLVAFVYFLTIALGCLYFVLIHTAMQGGWGVAVRRVAENAAGTLPLFALLFLPLALGRGHLYPWVHPEAGDALLRWKQPYLNEGFFLVRAAFYFVVWSAIALWFLRLSRRQDDAARPAPRGAAAALERPAPHPAGAHPHVRRLRLADVARPPLVLDDLRRVLVLGLAGRGLRLPRDRHGLAAPLRAGVRRVERRAPPRSRQAALHLHRLLGLHRLLAVLPDLVREPPGGDRLLPPPPAGDLGRRERPARASGTSRPRSCSCCRGPRSAARWPSPRSPPGCCSCTSSTCTGWSFLPSRGRAGDPGSRTQARC